MEIDEDDTPRSEGKKSLPPGEREPLDVRDIFERWWPLAASWVFMAIALPACTAVVARMDNFKVHLAAFGSYVFPLALIIEAPIIMLLAASTALSRDERSYRILRTFTFTAIIVLTIIHVLLAFTPLFDLVVHDLMNADEKLLEPIRAGLILIIPWTGAIAYRRLEQGVLIRYGFPRAVGAGAGIRLTCIGAFLAFGFYATDWSGTIVATGANSSGVLVEAVVIGFWSYAVKNEHIWGTEPDGEPLTWWELAKFYTPLALTSFLTLVTRPLISASMARMPRRLLSLDVWPTLVGLLFILRSTGMAFKEVVVSLLDRAQPLKSLWPFALYLSFLVTLLVTGIALTPMSDVWFQWINGLPGDMSEVGRIGLLVSIFIPGLVVMINFYQGIIVWGERTRGVIEAVSLFLLTLSVGLGAGIFWNSITGLYVAMVAFTLGSICRLIWLWYRGQPVIEQIRHREASTTT